MQSFLDHGHEFHLYTYADIGGIPAGAVVKDAESILPYAEATSGTQQDWSGLSDYFRYALLYKLGGWWVDMDTVCLRAFDFTEQEILIESADGYPKFTTWLLRFPPKHLLMETMLDICRRNVKVKKIGRTYLGGPPVLTEQIHKLKLTHLAAPRPWFFHSQTDAGNEQFFNLTWRDGLHFAKNNYLLHMGNNVSGKTGIEKNAVYDASSLFEQLKAKHGIANSADAKRITADEVNRIYGARNQSKAGATRRRKKREKMWVMAAAISTAALAVCLIL